MYNGEGEVLILVVTYKGSMPDALHKYFKGHVNMFQTDDGLLDHNTISIVICEINV